PQLVVVDLRDGRAETILQLRLRRLDVLPLPLQRARLGKVELDAQDPDKACAHGATRTYDVAAGGASSSVVRSISRVSYASRMSPSFTSLKPSRRIPHSNPSVTSRASSLKRFSWAIVVS